MPDLRLPLTDKNIANVPLAADGQYRARDTELAGFFVLVGTRTKSFMIQADLRLQRQRQSIRMKVAEVGEMSAREARAKAKTFLGMIAAGVDPRTTRRGVTEPVQSSGKTTLRDAWDRYRDSQLVRKNRSERTIALCKDHLERLLIDWLDRPLIDLADAPRLVADRHEKISQVNGPAMANGVM